MYDKLRAVQIDRIDLHEAVALASYAQTLKSAFEHRQIDVPEWLADSARTLDAEVGSRLRDARLKRLREAKNRLSALATPDQKRAALEKEIAALEAAVN